MHGHITAHGDSTDGVTTTAGIMIDGSTVVSTTHGTMEVSMTLGTTEEHGDSTILGTMGDIMVVGMAVGMVTLTTLVSTMAIIIQDTFHHRLAAHRTRTISEA